ncbi:MAG: DUF6580 family putative transport protein [Pirellulaceae bacterium]
MSSFTESSQRSTGKSRRVGILLAVLVFAVVMKLMPYLLTALGVRFELFGDVYPWSFTPLLAVGLFCGYVLRSLRVAVAVMLGFLLVGDLGVWALTGELTWAFYAMQPLNYLCLLMTVPMGHWLRTGSAQPSTKSAGGYGLSLFTGLVACVLFYVITNFASWASMPEYTKDLSGLATCYTLAIPFFRNMLLGTAFYTAILLSPVMLRVLFPASELEGELAMERETSR